MALLVAPWPWLGLAFGLGLGFGLRFGLGSAKTLTLTLTLTFARVAPPRRPSEHGRSLRPPAVGDRGGKQPAASLLPPGRVCSDTLERPAAQPG